MALSRIVESLKGQDFNTTNINLAFTNMRFNSNLKPTNVLARTYTAQAMRISNLGYAVDELPNVRKAQEVAETNITQYRNIQTKESIDMFNLFVDLIQPHATKAALAIESLTNFTKNLKTYANDFATLMGSLVKKSEAPDARSAPLVAELKEKEKPLKGFNSELKLIANDTEKVNIEMVSLANKAYLGLPHEAKGKTAQPITPTQGPGNN